MNQKKNKNKNMPVVISIIVCVVLLAVIIIVLLLHGTSKRSPQESESDQIEFETTEPETIKEDRFNFVIFGVDDVGYTPQDIYRSDMIMVVSIDPNENRINLISILRDSKVPIEGMEPQKINAAYQEGGVDLAMRTINNAFHTHFDKYLTLNWQDLVFLVDDIGGIEVEITGTEAEQINEMVNLDISQEGRNWYCEDVWEGVAYLDGTQATHFSRIRKIDSDYYRAWRQHRTLKAIQKKVQTMSAEDLLFLTQELMDNVVETNLTVDDVMKWMTRGIVNYEITSTIIPDEEYETNVHGGIDESTGWWVWDFDLEEGAARMHAVLGE